MVPNRMKELIENTLQNPTTLGGNLMKRLDLIGKKNQNLEGFAALAQSKLCSVMAQVIVEKVLRFMSLSVYAIHALTQ